MPSTGDGSGWDETLATDSGLVSDTGLEFRDLRKAVRVRLAKEHKTPVPSTNYNGGEHLAGSAKAYYQTSFPTKRPWDDTDISITAPNLDVDDSGRLMIKSDNGGLYYYDGTTSAWLPIKVVDISQLLNGVISFDALAAGLGNQITKQAIVYDKKTDTTDGGNFNNGAWRMRDLNFIQTDPFGIVSVAANQITIQPGTYRVSVRAPAYSVGRHQIRLRNDTAGSTIAFGTCEASAPSVGDPTYSVCHAEFTVVAATALSVEHHCEVTKTGNGFGTACSFGVGELYTQVVVQKLL